jgi:hypothetical protein
MNPHFNYFNDDVVIEQEMVDDTHKNDGKGTVVYEKLNNR